MLRGINFAQFCYNKGALATDERPTQWRSPFLL